MATIRKKEKWYHKLRNKYRLILFNDKTFEERFSFRLTRLNVIVLLVSLAIVFSSLNFLLIAYTPLKTYVPGYPDVDQRRGLYRLNFRADSLMNDIKMKNLYIENIKRIINNETILDSSDENIPDSIGYDTITNRKSVEDSLFRLQFEKETRYNLYAENGEGFQTASSGKSIQSLNFFKPLDGIITSKFNLAEKHYGIDIAASHNDAVKSVLDGTVILANWTLETGYILVIQHQQNLISVYKHNATLLKQEGDLVKAGDPIAITGQSGELSTGPHLHFELWSKGKPVDPQKFIMFN